MHRASLTNLLLPNQLQASFCLLHNESTSIQVSVLLDSDEVGDIEEVADTEEVVDMEEVVDIEDVE